MSEPGEDSLPDQRIAAPRILVPRQWGLGFTSSRSGTENRLTAEGRLLHEQVDLPGQSRRGPDPHCTRHVALRPAASRLRVVRMWVEFRPRALSQSNTSEANASPTIAMPCSYAHKHFAWKKCWTFLFRAAPFFTALRDAGWRSFSPPSCAVGPNPSLLPCTVCIAQASHLRRNPARTAAVAHWSTFASRNPQAEQPARASGWTGRCAACLKTHLEMRKHSEGRHMRKLLNTLHVTTQGAYVHRDGETLSVKIGNEVRLRLPVHTIESLVCYGQVTCSPFVLALCCERGVGVSLVTEHGRFLARVTGPVSGNVLLRRQQYRICRYARRGPAHRRRNCRREDCEQPLGPVARRSRNRGAGTPEFGCAPEPTSSVPDRCGRRAIAAHCR